jgi:hypothetical protein
MVTGVFKGGRRKRDAALQSAGCRGNMLYGKEKLT